MFWSEDEIAELTGTAVVGPSANMVLYALINVLLQTR
jgi:hypothetical protein